MKVKSDKRALEAIKPLINYCAQNRGAGVNEVMKRYKDKTGETPVRCMFNRWLNTDPKLRNEPRLGAGLVLIEIQKDMTDAAVINASKL